MNNDEKSREEKFAEAMQKRKQEKLEEEERRSGNWGGDFEQIPYCALESNQVKVVRLLGLPNHVKETEFDAKIINISMIAGDNDKPFRCIWPLKEERPDWLMWRIFDRVMEYEWDSTSNSKIYKHKDTHPAIFQKVFKNNKPHIVFEKGWKPSTMVLLNVLDRSNMEWHVENKKTKILSKRVSETVKNDGTSTFWYATGIPKMLYDMILDDIVTHYGDWTMYDLAITKLKADPWYKVAYLLKRKEEFDPEIVKLAFDGPITDEQALYQMNDLDQLYKITSYQKFRNRLKVFIQSIDSVFNTTYFEELNILADKEKEENAEKQIDKAAGYFEKEAKKEEQVESAKEQEKVAEKELKVEEAKKEMDDVKKDIQTDKDSIITEETPVRNVRAKKEEPKEESKFDKLMKLGYRGIEKLTGEEVDLIKEIHTEGSPVDYYFVYSSKEPEFHCPSCDFKSPGDFHCCPKCGEEFE